MAAHKNPRRAAAGEKLRVGADLEHWPAFHRSFEKLGRMIADVGTGRRGQGEPPATVCVVSGDVHHSFIARADYSHWPEVGDVRSNVYQLTCSPVHNWVPRVMNWAFSATWSPTVEHVIRILLSNLARVPRPPLRWKRMDRIVFGNAIATLVLEGRAARVLIESSQDDPEHALVTALAADLSSARD
jgi:hypothetical protein